ncbi:MAG: T9SS type A sorting domain-containing protein [candidate division Zixibacteria bacterium]|nr:T9SS type A sorting domain-containing protein [candidate division Zixibacteria bacterium]
MQKKLILLVFSIMFTLIMAQRAVSQGVIWQNTMGGYEFDEATSIQQTTDGGYITVGRSSSYGAGGLDYYLVKLDVDGDTLWSRTYGGAENEFANCVLQTSDGGYILAGFSDSYGPGNGDYYVVKTDEIGDTIWTRAYGFPTKGDYAVSVVENLNSEYIVIGYQWIVTGYDTWAIKLDSSGDSLWSRTFDYDQTDVVRGFKDTNDGGYIIAGYRGTSENLDFCLIKTDAELNVEWTNTYGGGMKEYAQAVAVTEDGGYLIAGYKRDDSGFSDIYLVRTDQNGGTLWEKVYVAPRDDVAKSVESLADGGFIIAGGTDSFNNGYYDVLLLKVDQFGNVAWEHTYGGSQMDTGNEIIVNQTGNYVIAGGTRSYGEGETDFYILEVAPLDFAISIYPDNYPITVSPGGSFTYRGFLANNTGNLASTDVWIKVRMPDGSYYGPVEGWANIFLEAGETIHYHPIVQNIPVYAPSGDYTYIAYTGEYPQIIDSTDLTFSVIEGIDDGTPKSEWLLTGWGTSTQKQSQIFHKILVNSYPNPFNVTANIEFVLPTESEVNLRVYNILGQQVAVLAEGRYMAGHHRIVWDASDYSSGVYFYKLTAGEKVFTRRMTLLK